LGQLPGQKAQLTYNLTRDEPDRETFKVHLDKNSLVVFSEAMFPGWKALVDGQPSSLMTSNNLFRTLFLTPGDHEVEFLFQPFWAKPLFLGALLWLLSAVGFTSILFIRRRKNPFPEGVKA
jgi:hypothetical protein